MAPPPLIRLVTQQQQRHDEIVQINARLRERNENELNKTIVKARLDKINAIWEDAIKTHLDIFVRVDSPESEYMSEKKFEALQDIDDVTSDFLLTRLDLLSNDGDRNPRRRNREGDDEDDELPAKLPRLDLPTFSGKYEDWDSFADMFSALVHNVNRISNTRKSQYLKSCLEGPAADLVKGVESLGINYESTWKTLEDRFYNPRLTINRLLDSLSDLPYLLEESATGLRSYVDEAQRIVRALVTLKVPVDKWDLWLVHMIEIRLDEDSRKTWESELISNDRQTALIMPDAEPSARFPKFADLMTFLERRAQSLSIVHADKTDKKSTRSSKSNATSRKAHHAHSLQPSKRGKCLFCNEDHYNIYCPIFLAKRASDRRKAVQNAKLCFNCLGCHVAADYQSENTCKECQKEHHTHHILLATAQVTIIGPNGKQTRARALLDQGSEVTFVSESLVQLLGLPRDRIVTELTGIGGVSAGKLKHATCFTIQSRVNVDFKLEINALVLAQVTSQLPSHSHYDLDFSQFSKLTLADPDFNISDRVDILLGADVYGQLLKPEVKGIPSTLLVAQNTVLGWVVSGPTKVSTSRGAASSNRVLVKALRCVVNDDLSESLQRFWIIEEVPVACKTLKPDDEACKRLFADTTTRSSDGRFQVRLPLKSTPPLVAEETKRMAFGSLNHQLHRLSRDPALANEYTEFMDKYAELEHMVPVPAKELYNPRAWYLPHYAVVQRTDEKLTVRVVFGASRRTREKHY